MPASCGDALHSVDRGQRLSSTPLRLAFVVVFVAGSNWVSAHAGTGFAANAFSSAADGTLTAGVAFNATLSVYVERRDVEDRLANDSVVGFDLRKEKMSVMFDLAATEVDFVTGFVWNATFVIFAADSTAGNVKVLKFNVLTFKSEKGSSPSDVSERLLSGAHIENSGYFGCRANCIVKVDLVWMTRLSTHTTPVGLLTQAVLHPDVPDALFFLAATAGAERVIKLFVNGRIEVSAATLPTANATSGASSSSALVGFPYSSTLVYAQRNRVYKFDCGRSILLDSNVIIGAAANRTASAAVRVGAVGLFTIDDHRTPNARIVKVDLYSLMGVDYLTIPIPEISEEEVRQWSALGIPFISTSLVRYQPGPGYHSAGVTVTSFAENPVYAVTVAGDNATIVPDDVPSVTWLPELSSPDGSYGGVVVVGHVAGFAYRSSDALPMSIVTWNLESGLPMSRLQSVVTARFDLRGCFPFGGVFGIFMSAEKPGRVLRYNLSGGSILLNATASGTATEDNFIACASVHVYGFFSCAGDRTIVKFDLHSMQRASSVFPFAGTAQAVILFGYNGTLYVVSHVTSDGTAAAPTVEPFDVETEESRVTAPIEMGNATSDLLRPVGVALADRVAYIVYHTAVYRFDLARHVPTGLAINTLDEPTLAQPLLLGKYLYVARRGDAAVAVDRLNVELMRFVRPLATAAPDAGALFQHGGRFYLSAPRRLMSFRTGDETTPSTSASISSTSGTLSTTPPGTGTTIGTTSTTEMSRTLASVSAPVVTSSSTSWRAASTTSASSATPLSYTSTNVTSLNWTAAPPRRRPTRTRTGAASTPPAPAPLAGALPSAVVASASASANVVAGVAGVVGAPAAAMTAGRAMAIPQLIGCRRRNDRGELWLDAPLTFPATYFPASVVIGGRRGAAARAAIVSILAVAFGVVVLVVLVALLLRNKAAPSIASSVVILAVSQTTSPMFEAAGTAAALARTQQSPR